MLCGLSVQRLVLGTSDSYFYLRCRITAKSISKCTLRQNVAAGEHHWLLGVAACKEGFTADMRLCGARSLAEGVYRML